MTSPNDVAQQSRASLPELDRALVLRALTGVVDPELGEDVVALGMVRFVEISGSQVRVGLALTIAGCPLRNQLHDDVTRVVGTLAQVSDVEVEISSMDKDERAALMSRARRLAQERAVKTDVPASARVLGIVSGKGGVGKSSLTVNLAISLAQRGCTVGVLDADIWGFSIPRMLGVEGPMQARAGKMVPLEQSVGPGLLKVVSMGFLSGENDAIMWRGLVLNRAVQHFLEDVHWGELDYLLVDMPPGTGDVQMGLARMLPHTELLVVTTPALAAQKVAGRAADMAQKGHLRIAGVIENMAGFTCEHGERYDLFGAGGGQRLADLIGAPLVGSIPIDPTMTAGGDIGIPAALGDGPLAKLFSELAEAVMSEIAPRREMDACSARMLQALDLAPKG